jgi:uncharacterized protein YkwD
MALDLRSTSPAPAPSSPSSSTPATGAPPASGAPSRQPERRAERRGERRGERRRSGWRRLATPIVAALAVALAAAACLPTSPAPGVSGDTFDAINHDRAAAGVGALAWDPVLAQWAQNHAHDIAASGTLWHSDLGSLISGPLSGYWTLGENLYQGPPGVTGAAVEATWMGSPPHRANVLNGAFNRVGVGVATDGSGQTWVVALFGAR